MTDLDTVLKNISELYEDRQYTLDEALQNMLQIKEEAEIFISALREDIRNRDE